jgi:drug/metabolite transporter (DMT)-like permease
VDAILLGLLAGCLFGAMTVAVRAGLLRGGEPAVGSVVVASSAFAIAVVLALPSATGGIPVGELWPFFAIGILVPGLSQIVVILAVRDAGPSRAAILIGMAPLLSVVLALLLLDEPLRPVLLAGTALVVAGGAVLALERGRPEGFRVLGVVLALVCAAVFAVRDNGVRWAAREFDAPALQASAASLLAATIATSAYVLVAHRSKVRGALRTTIPAFLPAGVVLGCAYGALVTGFDRGRVGIVAPLNATQSLWGVAFASLLYAGADAIGRRTVLAGALVVAGGALIGAFR